MAQRTQSRFSRLFGLGAGQEEESLLERVRAIEILARLGALPGERAKAAAEVDKLGAETGKLGAETRKIGEEAGREAEQFEKLSRIERIGGPQMFRARERVQRFLRKHPEDSEAVQQLQGLEEQEAQLGLRGKDVPSVAKGVLDLRKQIVDERQAGTAESRAATAASLAGRPQRPQFAGVTPQGTRAFFRGGTEETFLPQGPSGETLRSSMVPLQVFQPLLALKEAKASIGHLRAQWDNFDQALRTNPAALLQNEALLQNFSATVGLAAQNINVALSGDRRLSDEDRRVIRGATSPTGLRALLSSAVGVGSVQRALDNIDRLLDTVSTERQKSIEQFFPGFLPEDQDQPSSEDDVIRDLLREGR